MTTASSYWTDVISDIMLNGKEKEEETLPKKYEEWNKICFILSPPASWTGSLGMATLGLLESQAASALVLAKLRRC